MAYSELIKKFDKIRAYMREFYVYGFKSRMEYDLKSARSYDDERRRMESWLGDYMRFARTAEGKNVFLSVDSRSTRSNPFYKAWKAKSFTDGDITLHFILFDVLHSPEVKLTLTALLEEIGRCLRAAQSEMVFDESTVRKKLKEYASAGIIRMEKSGRSVLYSRAEDVQWTQLADAVEFFSEVAPCGVVGSFLQDKLRGHESLFAFKHHYITQAMDSGILALLLQAIREKRYITIENLGRNMEDVRAIRLAPVKIYISAQSGRQYLLALNERAERINAYRLDYILKVELEEPCEGYETLQSTFREMEGHMWGVNCRWDIHRLDHMEFDVYAGDGEDFIVSRLEREKRCGSVKQIAAHTWRFTADVYDAAEMLPWIRTFISRITRLRCSNRAVEARFREDMEKMYRLYGIEGGDEA